MPQLPDSYDSVAYRGDAIAECDPLRMAFVANLHGYEAVDPAACDVLDIGCGDAGNLLSLAAMRPGMHGTGIDPAAEGIARGEALRAAAGLGNVRLLTGAPEGSLDDSADYVNVHGVVSWVADEPRRQVLDLAARAVRPGGLVQISYHAFPGAHARLAARDLARDAVAQALARGETPSPPEQVELAIRRVERAAAVAASGSDHARSMKVQAERMRSFEWWSIFHDDLSEAFEPFRVTEVARMMASRGLTYVGELVPHDLWAARLRSSVAQEIRDQAGESAAARQVLVDQLEGSRFHSSLFVRSDRAPDPEPSLAGRPVFVRSFAPDTPDGDRRADAVSAPVSAVIRERRPATITVEQIDAELRLDRGEIEAALLTLDAYGLARLSTFAPPEPAGPGPMPRASPLVLAQLAAGTPYLSTRFHRTITFTKPANRLFVSLLDGTRDPAALRRDLPGAAAGAGVTDGVDGLLADVESALGVTATLGLLMPPKDDA